MKKTFPWVSFSVYPFLRTVLRTLLIASFFLIGTSAEKDTIDEYKVKAVFLVNFIKYVDWPSSYDNSFKIGVIGKSIITGNLKEIAEFKKSNSRPLEILEYDSKRPVLCDILFIPNSEMKRISKFAKDMEGKKVLIVSEDNNSSSHLAGINLIKTKGKIKFEVNEAALKKSGLKLSSQLSTLAVSINQ